MSGAWSQLALYALAFLIIFVQWGITKEKGQRVEDDRWEFLFAWGAFWTFLIAFNGGPAMDKVWNRWLDEFYNRPYLGEDPVSRWSLLWRQAQVMGGALVLFGLIWGTIHYYGERMSAGDRGSELEFLNAFLGRLALAFWLPVLGIGAIYGMSPNHTPLDVIRHPGRLFGPVTLLAVEMTVLWFPAAIALWRHRRDPSPGK